MSARRLPYPFLAQALLAALVLAWLPAQAHCGEPRKAAFIPQWEPQAQFAGVFVAQAMGFYREAGIDLTILRGGPGAPSSKLLAEGAAQFGSMFLASAIARCDEGLPLVNLAQIVSHSGLLLVAKKARGILTPKDLDGRRVSIWGPEFRVQLDAFFKKHGVKVNALPQGFTVNLFLYDGVDAASAMRYNEYHSIVNAGLDPDELTVFDLGAEGLGFPEDGIYCLRSAFEKDPELCRDFAAATIKGWKYAFDNPAKALDIVMSHVASANLPTNRAHQAWMLARLREAARPEEPGFGLLDKKAYMAVSATLIKDGFVHAAPRYEDFHVPPR
jgi:NitT/TauT family transport system substrate-binding protein